MKIGCVMNDLHTLNQFTHLITKKIALQFLLKHF